MEGCDSSGHINGTKEHHFLTESCPSYHNLTKGGINDPHRLKERLQADKDRMQRYADNPTGYQEFIQKRRKRDRIVWSEAKLIPPQKTQKSKEPNLNLLGCSPFDLNLFREGRLWK